MSDNSKKDVTNLSDEELLERIATLDKDTYPVVMYVEQVLEKNTQEDSR